MVFGQWTDPLGGETIDEGLAVFFQAPQSYTGNDLAEFHCHGGRVCPRRLIESALHLGARLAEPGEFTRRAFLNGRIDLTQAEAVADLINAQTDAAARPGEGPRGRGRSRRRFTNCARGSSRSRRRSKPTSISRKRDWRKADRERLESVF